MVEMRLILYAWLGYLAHLVIRQGRWVAVWVSSKRGGGGGPVSYPRQESSAAIKQQPGNLIFGGKMLPWTNCDFPTNDTISLGNGVEK